MAGEAKLQSQITDYLKPRRDVWFLNKWGNGVEKGGIPDILICYKGFFIAMELKNPNGSYDTSPRQKIELQKIRKSGGIALKIDNFHDFLIKFNSL